MCRCHSLNHCSSLIGLNGTFSPRSNRECRATCIPIRSKICSFSKYDVWTNEPSASARPDACSVCAIATPSSASWQNTCLALGINAAARRFALSINSPSTSSGRSGPPATSPIGVCVTPCNTKEPGKSLPCAVLSKNREIRRSPKGATSLAIPFANKMT